MRKLLAYATAVLITLAYISALALAWFDYDDCLGALSQTGPTDQPLYDLTRAVCHRSGVIYDIVIAAALIFLPLVFWILRLGRKGPH